MGIIIITITVAVFAITLYSVIKTYNSPEAKRKREELRIRDVEIEKERIEEHKAAEQKRRKNCRIEKFKEKDIVPEHSKFLNSYVREWTSYCDYGGSYQHKETLFVFLVPPDDYKPEL